MKHFNEKLILTFKTHLYHVERAQNTVTKYIRDVRRFAEYADGQSLSRELVLKYKEEIGEMYSPMSANSMLAALNSFFRFVGWDEFCVQLLKIQRRIYSPEEKELSKGEYNRLVDQAKKKRKGAARAYDTDDMRYRHPS